MALKFPKRQLTSIAKRKLISIAKPRSATIKLAASKSRGAFNLKSKAKRKGIGQISERELQFLMKKRKPSAIRTLTKSAAKGIGYKKGKKVGKLTRVQGKGLKSLKTSRIKKIIKKIKRK